MRKGSKHTLESRNRLRLASIENAKINPNYGWRGKKHPQHVLDALLKANIGKKYSLERKKKLSERFSGVNNPMYGTKGEKCPFYGRHHTIEVRNKIRLGKIGSNNPSYGKTGEKSYRWNGGTSFMPYDKNWNKRFKLEIKGRDKFCMLCGNNIRQLHIHHIDYNKEHTTFSNCISLCNNCHSKTNTKRQEWTSLFSSILKNKYGY